MCIPHGKFYILIIISEDSASYFLKMIMLINFVGTLTQAETGVGRITFPSEGSMRGQYVFFSANYELCINIFYFNISTDSVSYFFKMITLISLVGALTQTRMGIGKVTFTGRG